MSKSRGSQIPSKSMSLGKLDASNASVKQLVSSTFNQPSPSISSSELSPMSSPSRSPDSFSSNGNWSNVSSIPSLSSSGSNSSQIPSASLSGG